MRFLEKIPGFGALVWVWNNRTLVTILASAGLIAFLAWQLDMKRDKVKELKAENKLLQTVVTEYENAARELEGKATYEKTNTNIAAESAAAVAAGRQGGDGPMAPVLRTEYERVQRLAKERAGGAR